MFFDGWYGLGRVVIAATVGYVALVLTLRTSGKRTLSKMNAFDLVVTVALGSSFATLVLSRDVVILEGVLAFVVLALLQSIVAWLSVRSSLARGLVKAKPTLVFYRGQFDERALREERLTEGEVLAAARAQGIGSLGDVDAVVLETAGDLSVIHGGAPRARSTLVDVKGVDVKGRSADDR